MRLWVDDNMNMLTDEQLLRLVAHCGSLGAALAQGNVRLVASSDPERKKRKPGEPYPKLRDYLAEEK